MKKNTSWKFTDELSITFHSSVSGAGKFGLKLIIFKLVTPEIHNQLILYKQSVESAMFTTTAERNFLRFSSSFFGMVYQGRKCRTKMLPDAALLLLPLHMRHRAHKSLSEV